MPSGNICLASNVWPPKRQWCCCNCGSAVHKTVLKGKNTSATQIHLYIVPTWLTLSCNTCKLCSVLWCTTKTPHKENFAPHECWISLNFLYINITGHTTRCHLHTFYNRNCNCKFFLYCWPYRCVFLSQDMPRLSQETMVLRACISTLPCTT